MKVKPTANAQCILDKGLTKHGNHDEKVHEGLEYVLLYPDHSEVIHLPGTNEEFILEKYREDVRKSYNRITLFIAFKSDFLMAELLSLDDDIEDDLYDGIMENIVPELCTCSPEALLNTLVKQQSSFWSGGCKATKNIKRSRRVFGVQ